MTVTTLFLARHGQSLWNGRKRVTGQLNPGLAPTGRAQARALAALLRGISLSAIHASDLSRSRDTAQAVADSQGLMVREETALREIHFGTMQGRFRDDRDPDVEVLWRARKAAPVAFRAPGGETFADLASRAVPVVHRILKAHPGGRVLIVGHRHTNRAILGALLGWPPEVAVTAAVAHDCLYRLQLETPPVVSAIRFGARAPAAGAVPS